MEDLKKYQVNNALRLLEIYIQEESDRLSNWMDLHGYNEVYDDRIARNEQTLQSIKKLYT